MSGSHRRKPRRSLSLLSLLAAAGLGLATVAAQVGPQIVDIDAKLGFPQRDPHGDPIPASDGQVPTPPARQLWACGDGETKLPKGLKPAANWPCPPDD